MPIFTTGEVVRDTYEIERFLGEGAFAEVYRVRHRFLGRQALKVFKRVGMSFADIREMLGEAMLLSKLGHPNIVRVFDANVLEIEGRSRGYLTMEHLGGGSLHKFWNSFGLRLVPIGVSLDIIKQVCRGLSVAHAGRPPVVHRDLKPQNILIGYEQQGLRVRVSDFGLARSVDPETLLTHSAGTPDFKPPESRDGGGGDSCASDTWAIAAMLYQLVTDRLPFAAAPTTSPAPPGGPAAPLLPPSRVNPDAGPALDAVLSTALHADPSKRYGNAQELLAALEGVGPKAGS